MVCRLKILDTISSFPVLRLEFVKYALKVSKIPLKNYLEYTSLTQVIGQ